jgi:hypothetical protein
MIPLPASLLRKFGVSIIAALSVAVLLWTVSHFIDRSFDVARASGATHATAAERAVQTEKVLENVKKANDAASGFDPVRAKRLREKWCRDCAHDQ